MYTKSLFPPLPPSDHLTVHDLLFNRADQEDTPDYLLYVDVGTGRKATRDQFLRRVVDAGRALGGSEEDRGLGWAKFSEQKEKPVVGIMSENCLDYIVLVHALVNLTIPVALIPTYATPRELTHTLGLAKPKYMFVHANVLPKVYDTMRHAGVRDEDIYLLEGRDGREGGRKSLDDLIQGVSGHVSGGDGRVTEKVNVPARLAKKNDLAYLVFSSGTSGLPKAVMISHGNLKASILQFLMVAVEAAKVIEPIPPSTPDGMNVILAFLPFYHTYGLHAAMFRFIIPNTQIIMPHWNIDLALDLIQKYKISTLPLIPSVIHQLVNSPKFQNADLSSLTSITSGAAHFPPELERKLSGIAKAPRITEGYGMSESTVIILTRSLPGLLNGLGDPTPGSTGILVPGVEARIVKEDGTEAAYGEPGELWVRGEAIALGYYGNEKATRETFVEGGWLRTGDRMRGEKGGAFFFDDRVKDTLKISGQQVSPAELESTLLSHPHNLLTDAAVAGVPGGRTSDERIPRAWVVLSAKGLEVKKRLGKGNAGVERMLEEWIKGSLSRFKWLRGGVEVVEEIPKSPTGKVLRRVLQDQYIQSQAQSQAQSQPTSRSKL